jgi:hypothetical protein
MRLELTHHFAIPLRNGFDYIVEPRNWPEYWPGLMRVQPGSRWREPGDRALVTMRLLGRTVLYDLGDFVDDYAVDRRLRNDLGLLFLLDLDAGGARRLEAIPLRIERCHTRLATGDDADWLRRRFTDACAEFGTQVTADQGRLIALVSQAEQRRHVGD